MPISPCNIPKPRCSLPLFVEQHVEWHDAMNKVLATSFFLCWSKETNLRMATSYGNFSIDLRHFWSTDVRKWMELCNDGGFEVGKFSKYLHSGVRFFGMLHPIPSKSQVLLGSLGDVNPLGFGSVRCWHDWFEFLGQHLGLVSTGDYAWRFKLVTNLSALLHQNSGKSGEQFEWSGSSSPRMSVLFPGNHVILDLSQSFAW